MKKKSIVFLWFVAVLSLTGCATTPTERSLSSDHASSVREADVYVVFPQKELYALFPGFSVGGNGEFGLIGYLINQYENSKAYKTMRSQVDPVAAATSNVDWGRDLETALRRANVFADPARVRFVALPEGDDPMGALVKSAEKPWVVVVNGAYYLDAWYRVLTLGSDVSVWKRGEARPVHTFRTVYYSRPITSDMEFLISGKMAPLWAHNNGAPLRTYEAEAVREVAGLIRTAFVDRPSSLVTPADVLEDYVDWDRMQWLPRKAKRVSAGDNRVVLIDENGRLLSASKEPTYVSSDEARRPLAPGMARIYVYQAKGLHGFAPDVQVNGASAGPLQPRTYFPLDVKPGTHTLTLKYDGDVAGATVARKKINAVKPVPVDAKAGERYFVRFDGYQGLVTSSEAMKAVAAVDAEAELAPLIQRY